MASIPLTGTYVAHDWTTGNDYMIQITSATSRDGQLNGTYTASDGPYGPFTTEAGPLGRYFWVGSAGGGDTPFSVYIAAVLRPGGWPYCICDTWAGAYLKENLIVMEGARCLVTNEGKVRLSTFKESKFVWQAG
jgi:hypothetical protein